MRRTSLALLAALLAPHAAAQIGGNGAQGALNPTTDLTLTTSAANQGVFQFTSITIAAGITVRVVGPLPAVLRCQGAVVIDGVLDLDARQTTPGAGGYRGGCSGLTPCRGQGPGGGAPGFISLFGEPAAHATQGNGLATPYGDVFPFDLQGGSGGGGARDLGGSYVTVPAGAGGGALALLADGAITVRGAVTARGGDVWYTQPPFSFPIEVTGGPGSGGAILLRSMAAVQGTGRVDVAGGVVRDVTGTPLLSVAGDGWLRLDSYATAPAVAGARLTAGALVEQLPLLRELAPPAIGQVWQPRCATVPGDVLGWWMATRTLATPLQLPFGRLYLDFNPGGGFVFAGQLQTPTEGIDPLAATAFPVPAAPALQGLTFYSQMFNGLGTAAPRPRLSGLLTSTVQ